MRKVFHEKGFDITVIIDVRKQEPIRDYHQEYMDLAGRLGGIESIGRTAMDRAIARLRGISERSARRWRCRELVATKARETEMGIEMAKAP